MSALTDKYWPRFAKKFTYVPSGCWIWTATKTKSDGHGYGIFRTPASGNVAHRAAYVMLVGAVPAGLEADHLCREKLCVNPYHLEWIPHFENIQRGAGGRRTQIA